MYYKNLQAIRKKLNLTTNEIAAQLDLTVRTYSSYERGERKPPIDFFEKIYKIFNVNLNFLICSQGEIFNAPTYEQVEDELTQKVEAILRKNGLMK